MKPSTKSLAEEFYLGKYEVTQAQYEAVMTGNTDDLNAKPSYWPNNNDHPLNKFPGTMCRCFCPD